MWTQISVRPGKWNTLTMKHEVGSDTNCNWCTWNGHQGLENETGRVYHRKTSQDPPNLIILKVTCCHSNSSERPSTDAGVKKIAKSFTVKLLRVFHTSVSWWFDNPGRNHYLTLVRKFSKILKRKLLVHPRLRLVNIYIYIYIYQPLRSGRIWHKVNS